MRRLRDQHVNSDIISKMLVKHCNQVTTAGERKASIEVRNTI